jgi:hypothetical protein
LANINHLLPLKHYDKGAATTAQLGVKSSNLLQLSVFVSRLTP